MTDARVAVLIPTHDNGRTLLVSARSALAQTHTDLEVLIVGDGVSDEGREAARELERADERVRFFDNPKGERHGEAHRHSAFAASEASFGFCLSDDDIWLPGHVATLLPFFEAADFVGGPVVRVNRDSSLKPIPHDLANRHHRDLFLDGYGRLALSGGAFTRAAYETLSPGWAPAPADIATDLHFFNGFLASNACRAVSCPTPTVLRFPAGQRRDMTSQERLTELEEWFAKVSDPAGLERVQSEIAASWQSAALEFAIEVHDLKRKIQRRRERRRKDEDASRGD